MANEAPENSVELDESSVTMLDILNDQKELEATTNAVLGGSDSNNCSYVKGYLTRQALYSCLTCIPECKENPNKRAGICLACSDKCHENHELVELYTKRNFRCDCGTAKFPNKKCLLDPLKLEPNVQNSYNQNFSGLYCVCHRPYPDLEDDIKDQMIQCAVCEDWYHTRHLEADTPDSDEYSEMICGQCMGDMDFLKYYYTVLPCVNATGNNLDESKTNKDAEKSVIVDVESVGPIVEKKHKLEDGAEESASKKLKLDACKKPKETDYLKGAAFWTEGWRKNLCTCTECMLIYKDKKVEYLLDEEDTVQWYEENGKNHLESDIDREMRALSSLDRVRQVDAIVEYNRMKEKLKEFLNTFVVNQQVVTEADINQFFATLKNDKNGPLIQPNFCR